MSKSPVYNKNLAGGRTAFVRTKLEEYVDEGTIAIKMMQDYESVLCIDSDYNMESLAIGTPLVTPLERMVYNKSEQMVESETPSPKPSDSLLVVTNDYLY